MQVVVRFGRGGVWKCSYVWKRLGLGLRLARAAAAKKKSKAEER